MPPAFRRCPQCGNEYLFNPRYFYVRGDGRFEYCQGPGTQNCHERYWRGRAQSKRAKQRFGVEIEFVGNADDVARELRAAGVAANVESYNHTTRSTWKIVGDASVINGAELVSPPMPLSERSMTRIKTVLSAASRVASVSSACGFHVHCEVRSFSRTELVNVLQAWVDWQDTVKYLVHHSRWGNRYAQDCSQEDIEDLRRGHIDFEDISRYRNLNVASFPRYGTLEFRSHGGTLNHQKVIAWVQFCQAFVSWGRNSASPGPASEVPAVALNELLTILTAHGLSPSSAEFLLRRAEELAGRTQSRVTHGLTPPSRYAHVYSALALSARHDRGGGVV